MAELTEGQIAYFHASPTRQELLTVVLATMETMAAVVNVATADNSADRLAALDPLRDQSEKLSVLIREMLNEGVDPEWDYRA